MGIFMGSLLTELLSSLVNDSVSGFDQILSSILSGILKIEALMNTIAAASITVLSIQSVYDFLYGAAGGLLILKFLWKGFQIYILWRDGDADNSPQDMLIGAVQAIVTILVFPYLYDIMVKITMQLADGIMARFGMPSDTGSTLPPISLEGISLFLLLIFVIYIVMLFLMTILLIRRGFELLVLRLGVPFACMGLIDSDGGLFKSYMQIFFKTMFTSIIQITLLSLSLRFAATLSLLNLLCAIAAISTAFKTPALMQQMLVPTGQGGGITNKIYTGSMALRSIKSLIGR